MPQIFPHWFDSLARAGLLGAALMVPATAVALAAFYRSNYVTGARVAYLQPVPFSHEHHTGRLGIDCRYCHTSVEVSAFAGVPSTDICMHCHQQIWVGAELLAPVRESWRTDTPLRWTRVHNLPGFVYFHHGVHVSKGVGCVECHGRVDRMPLTWQVEPLTMEWCLNCHRAPERRLRPRGEVTSLTWTPADETDQATGRPYDERSLGLRLKREHRIGGEYALTRCSVCHR